MSQNHILDPTFFQQALDEFKFDFDWYYQSEIPELDDLGRQILKYEKRTIQGSLQSAGTTKNYSKDGNTQSMKYNFYCMSKYRIDIDDFIVYKNRYLIVDGVNDFDEHGVRNCTLTMINLNNYKDLRDAIAYLNGDKIV